MNNENDLFTNEQSNHIQNTCCQLIGKDFMEGAKIISGEIALEPLKGGIRVTARDSEHQTLWGFIASAKTLEQMYSSVGVYITLQKLIAQELGLRPENDKIDKSIIPTVQQEITSLKKILDKLSSSLEVKMPTDATFRRGKTISEVINNVIQLIETELSSS
jgi:hypothetical protein